MSIMSKYSKTYSEKYDKIFKKRCIQCGRDGELKMCGEWFCSDCAAEISCGESKHVEDMQKIVDVNEKLIKEFKNVNG